MLKSLFSGVSGLRNHQMQLDVIGNNIANINTVGYKGGRIMFTEALNQTIRNATPSSGVGFVNPMQVGLGSKTSAIENIWQQGGLQNTGIITDLALEGEGFFVVGSGDQNLFTRNGQFFFDADGKLINQAGLSVMGWMLDQGVPTGGLGSGNLTDIIIDSNMISEAQETGNVHLSGNLNAGLETLAEVWTLSSAFTVAGVDAVAGDDLNTLDQTNTALVAGDTITISGTNPDGSAVAATYTYAAGDTVQDLLDAITASYTGATATLANGQIVLTDNVAGDSSTSINLAMGAGATGDITIPGFSNTTAGETGTSTTSVLIYDSIGAAHNMIITFTKTATDGSWTWAITGSGNETVVSGGTGEATFSADGTLASFTYDAGASALTMDPGNGANQMNVNLVATGDDEHAGISQYDSLSTLTVREQDGRAIGSLLSLSVDSEGVIFGNFTNGEIENIAKVAIAKFENYTGLSDLGNGLYKTSIASGTEQIIALEDNISTTVVSGSLEMSNVDLSTEFTDMITAQRGFQAAAKVITTADTILNDLIQLKR